MANNNQDQKRICDLVKKHLRKFPPYREEHGVRLREFDDGKLWIGYRTTGDNIPRGTTHFDLNIINGTCYILWIELSKQERGENHGKALYAAIEQFAREFGCDRIRMTASGWTPKGDTRLEYMKNLGYHEIGDEVEKIL